MTFKERLKEAKIKACRGVWRSVNINRTLAKIANETGMTPVTIHQQLKMVGLKRKKPVKPIKPYEPPAWSAVVDWTLQDILIARQVGLTRERIRQIRLLLGKPQAKNHHKPTQESPAKKWFQKNMDKSGKMTAKEVSEAAGVHQSSARSVAGLYGFELRHPDTIRPWNDVDWRLPNSDLGEIWKMKDPPSQKVPGFRFAQIRNRYQKPKAKWTRIWGNKPIGHEYQIALGQEQAKADRWFKKQTSNTKESHAPQSVQLYRQPDQRPDHAVHAK